jgi:VanZ family protein
MVTIMRLRRLLVVSLTLAWAVQIFWLSTEGFGTGHSKSMLLGLLNLLHLRVSSESLEMINSILRILAHVVEYAILSILLYFLFLSCDRFVWRIRSAYWCIVGASAYALTDEFHQLFVRGRGASLGDCCIDAAGAAVGMLVVYVYSQVSADLALRRRSRHELSSLNLSRQDMCATVDPGSLRQSWK